MTDLAKATVMEEQNRSCNGRASFLIDSLLESEQPLALIKRASPLDPCSSSIHASEDEDSVKEEERKQQETDGEDEKAAREDGSRRCSRRQSSAACDRQAGANQLHRLISTMTDRWAAAKLRNRRHRLGSPQNPAERREELVDEKVKAEAEDLRRLPPAVSQSTFPPTINSPDMYRSETAPVTTVTAVEDYVSRLQLVQAMHWGSVFAMQQQHQQQQQQQQQETSSRQGSHPMPGSTAPAASGPNIFSLLQQTAAAVAAARTSSLPKTRVPLPAACRIPRSARVLPDASQAGGSSTTTSKGNIKKYRCDICGKTFSRSNTLITHKRIHTGEKPFKCDSCGRAFRQPGNLTRHRLTHTTSQQHEEQYSSQTHRANNMKNSIPLKPIEPTTTTKLLQLQVKPYVCGQCDKAFNRASNLHTHMRTHMGG